MNRSYRTVRNAGLEASVAAAENVRASRAGRVRFAHTIVAGAALIACGMAQAASFTATTEADLITAINAANASADPTSTITFTAPITVTTQLPQIKANVTVDTATRTTTIGSAAGASLNVQAGATYQGTAIQVGTVANTIGSVIAQGANAKLSGASLTIGAGQGTLSVLDGASAVFTGNLATGAGNATINVGNGASVSAANLNSGTGQTAINVTGGGTIALGTNANLGGGNGAGNGGVTNVVVSGAGSILNPVGGYYHHDGTLEVSAGGFVGANTVQVGLRAGEVFTATVTGTGSVFGSINNNLSIGGAGAATVTVADGARLTSGSSGTNTLSLASSATGVSTLNIGAPVGSAPVAPGLVTANDISAAAGTSTVNFNHNASNYEFAVPIGGNAVVNQIGSGTTVLTGANTYTGGTHIASGTLQLGNGGATGSVFGNVTNDGTLAIDRKDAYAFTGAISGGGAVRQLGAGTTTLSGTNTYTGGTTVQAGTLKAGGASAFVQNTAYTVNGGTLDLGGWDLQASSLAGSGGTVALNAQTLTVNQVGDSAYAGAITGTGGLAKTGAGVLTLSGTGSYTGATQVGAGTLRAGAANTFSKASAFNVASGATLDLAGNSQTLASVTNAGTVSLVGAAPGTTLTVAGPWVGNGGTLRLGTVLGDSASAIDRLVLSGATAIASGTTNVQIVNLNGLGALTTGNGIEVISAINGATTTAQTTKSAFALAGGHVDAGAYEYRLYAADASGAGENWYLRSTVPVTPPAAGGAGGTGGTGGTGSGAVVVPAYRAEVPLYAALPEQLRQANLSMLANLRQRVGDDGVSGANAAASGQGYRQAWGRVISTERTISQGGTVSPTSKGRLTGFQAGTDLWADPNWRVGVYAGKLDGDMRVNGFASGLQNLGVGSTDLRNEYIGAYANWNNNSGLYVDGVLQGGRHRYSVSPALNFGSGGKGDSLLASIEVGQSFPLAESWRIEPQLQLVHQRVTLDGTSIAGAFVRQDSHEGWLARAGVRVKGKVATGAGLLQPYVRVNVYRSSSGTDVARFIGPAGATDIATRTGGTSTELAGGATLQVTDSVSLYAEVGKLWSSGGGVRTEGSVDASLGVKLRW